MRPLRLTTVSIVLSALLTACQRTEVQRLPAPDSKAAVAEPASRDPSMGETGKKSGSGTPIGGNSSTSPGAELPAPSESSTASGARDKKRGSIGPNGGTTEDGSGGSGVGSAPGSDIDEGRRHGKKIR